MRKRKRSEGENKKGNEGYKNERKRMKKGYK